MMVYFIILGFVFIALVYLGYLYKSYISPKKLIQIAKILESGNTKLAIRALKSFLTKQERNPLAHWYLGEAYFREKSYELAIVEFKYLLKLGRYPSDFSEIDVRRKLVTIYKEFNQLEEAQKELILISNLEPDNYINYFQIGEIFFLRNYSENALSYFQKALRLNPLHPDSHYYLGILYFRSGRINDAMKELNTAIQYEPTHYKSHLYLGLINKNLNAYEAAIKEFNIASRDPELKRRCILEIGKSYLDKGEIHSATVELERALKISNEENDLTVEIRYYLAECYEKARDLPGAIAQWEKIAEIRPGYKDVAEKLTLYSELRTDDRLKDFIIASSANFSEICRKLIAVMGLNVVELSQISDEEIAILATETESKWRSTRKSNRLIKIRRTGEPIGEFAVRELHEELRRYNAPRGIFITSSVFAPSAQEYALTRPIDLIDKKKLIELLKQITD